MAQVGAVFAEFERALIAARTAEALGELRRQGRAWNHAPFGWHVVDGNLVADAVEQETLARARDLRSAGMGYASIAKVLVDEGRQTKRGGVWAAMSVRSVLRTSASMSDQVA
jgi:site-specific DNA recombinase